MRPLPPPAHTFVAKVVLLSLSLFVFSGSLSLGVVWMRQEIFSTKRRNCELEVQIKKARNQLNEVRSEVSTAISPSTLLKQNTDMKLGLVLPKEIQVQRIAESPELVLIQKRNSYRFTQNTTASDNFSESAAASAIAGASSTATSFRVITDKSYR